MKIPDVSSWTHQFDADSAECLVFVLKEGILSTISHDLKLKVEDFEVAVDQPTRSVAAIFNTESISVVTAMKDGQDDPGGLAPEQRTQIELIIRLEVLKAREYPDIVFISESADQTESGYVVRGGLTIQATTQPITFPLRLADGCYVAEAKVHQPDFGIEPYSAMMGGIRVRPTVSVRLSIPAP